MLIDDTPLGNMNVSNNSNIRPLNESSVEDDEDDDQETDEEEEQPQMNGNQSKVPTENGGNGNNNGSGNLNNKTLLVSLLKQINLLHETNSKIFRNLHETKGECVNQIIILKKKKIFSYSYVCVSSCVR